MLRRSLLALSTLILVISISNTAYAEVPQLINYQGILLSSENAPIITPVSVVFAIWDAEIDGDSLWSETQTVTPDTDGRFNVLLGAISPIPDSAFSGDAFLSMKVETDEEMAPRSLLASVAHTYRVRTVDGASGGAITGNLTVAGNLGVGIEEPTEPLEVQGTISSTAGGFKFPDGSTQLSAMRSSAIASVGLSNSVRLDDWTTLTQLLSKTVQAPTQGHMLVMVTVEMNLSSNGTSVEIGISDQVDLLPEDGIYNLSYSPDAGGGSRVLSIHRHFPVNEGEHTFFLLARYLTTVGFADVITRHMSVIFIPETL